jgi:hypothetical protein
VNAAAFRTRFEGWSRGPALALIAALAVLILLAAWTPARTGGAAPKMRAPTEHSDLQLYRDIIAGVSAGGNYYDVAAREQRAAGYPLKPFFTFRLPTHATIYAAVGERVMIGAFWLLAAAMMAAWWFRLKTHLPFPLLGAAMVLLAAGLGGLLQPQTGLFHESWTALLLALMIAVYRKDRVWPAMIAGAAALMVRELALPMILAMGGLAAIDRRWREAAGWIAIIAVFAVYMLLHAQAVAHVVLAADQASQGWSRTLGPRFALKSIAKVTAGIRLPDLVASTLLILSLFGWASVRSGWALRAFLLLTGYGAMVALFARADTFYWALIAAPLAFVGLTFLPKAFADLAQSVRRRPYPAQ